MSALPRRRGGLTRSCPRPRRHSPPGRTYIANIQTDSTQQEDLYQAFVYTRGGPEWQTVQVPFSDFLLTSLGYVQNEQASGAPPPRAKLYAAAATAERWPLWRPLL